MLFTTGRGGRLNSTSKPSITTRKTNERHLLNDDFSEEMLQKIKRYPIRAQSESFGDKLGYVFFLKPDLNLFEGDVLNEEAGNNVYLHSLFNDKKIGRKILYSLGNSRIYKNPFLPILGNRAKSFSPIESSLRINEMGETITGHKVILGADNEGEVSGGNFSIPFTDDSNQLIYHTIKIWKEYIADLYRGRMKKSRKNRHFKILDYAPSLMFITTRSDGTILNWWKYYGVFPIDLSPDAYSYTVGTSNMLEFSVTFQYSLVTKSMDLFALGEFKNLSDKYLKSEKKLDGTILLDYDAELDTHGEVFVTAPFIYRESSNVLKLKWR